MASDGMTATQEGVIREVCAGIARHWDWTDYKYNSDVMLWAFGMQPFGHQLADMFPISTYSPTHTILSSYRHDFTFVVSMSGAPIESFGEHECLVCVQHNYVTIRLWRKHNDLDPSRICACVRPTAQGCPLRGGPFGIHKQHAARA